MKKKEALVALAEGKKVRLEFWEENSHILISSTGDIVDDNLIPYPSWNNSSDEGWELYKEKKKVKVEFFARMYEVDDEYFFDVENTGDNWFPRNWIGEPQLVVIEREITQRFWD